MNKCISEKNLFIIDICALDLTPSDLWLKHVVIRFATWKKLRRKGYGRELLKLQVDFKNPKSLTSSSQFEWHFLFLELSVAGFLNWVGAYSPTVKKFEISTSVLLEKEFDIIYYIIHNTLYHNHIFYFEWIKEWICKSSSVSGKLRNSEAVELVFV